MLLLHCVCASPDASSSAVFAYSSWIGRVFGLCVYETSALDIIGFICIAVHVITWALLVLPQLRRNYVHRSAANLSLLYLGFWLASEASFMAAIALERWSWLWMGLRIWRTLMVSTLMAQALYYKFCVRNDFAAAVEAPYARGGPDGDGYFSHDDEFEYEAKASHGWPTRSPTNPAPAPQKSRFYGMAPEQWGHALLGEGGGGTPPPHPSSSDLSSSPTRSRLPSAHAHLSSAQAPRTISPSQSPKITTRTLSSGSATSSRGGPVVPASTHGVNAAPIDNDRRRAAYAAQKGPESNGFHTSPGSAFRPVLPTDEHEPLFRSSSSSNGGGSGSATLYAMGGLCMLGLTVWSMSGDMGVGVSHQQSASHAGRVLLSSDALGVVAPHTSTAFSSLWTAGNSSDASSSSFCNEPYSPSWTTAILIRVFGWVGCAAGAMSFFPQYIFNDSFMKSTDGLSFTMYALMLVGNLAFVGGVSLPDHNDWLSNRYVDAFPAGSTWYLDQVVMPLLVVHAFNFMQIWVLVVQRARYKRAANKR